MLFNGAFANVEEGKRLCAHKHPRTHTRTYAHVCTHKVVKRELDCPMGTINWLSAGKAQKKFLNNTNNDVLHGLVDGLWPLQPGETRYGGWLLLPCCWLHVRWLVSLAAWFGHTVTPPVQLCFIATQSHSARVCNALPILLNKYPIGSFRCLFAVYASIHINRFGPAGHRK